MFKLTNKRAIVTGAAAPRGIGRAIALAFARQGADVAICDIDLEGVERLAKEVREIGREVLVYKVDVTQASEIAGMIDDLNSRWGGVDILVNNAGITQRSTVIDMSEDDWDRVIAVNLKGTFLFTKALLPGMIAQKYGRIINMGSVSGKRGGGSFWGGPLFRSQGRSAGFRQGPGKGSESRRHYRQFGGSRIDCHRHPRRSGKP